ncbi:MAG: hypothetical protein AB9842_13995 [Bacteroidales bacterium]
MTFDFILGIDDTDNLESRGTGFRVRDMVRLIHETQLAEVFMITRHQLLVNPAIPYTSHNSSASVTGRTCDLKVLQNFCEQYLRDFSATGSDAGFCMGGSHNVAEEIIQWGYRAKTEILTMPEALNIAEKYHIELHGLTGEHTGIIGALAALGLRKGNSDGRVLWMPELREIKGIVTASELMNKLAIDRILNKSGEFIPLSSRIDLGEWFRPVMKDNCCILYVEETDHKLSEFRVAAKEYIKSISE